MAIDITALYCCLGNYVVDKGTTKQIACEWAMNEDAARG